MGEKHVTLEQMLAAKERRVLRQRALLEQYGQSLVCLTMNIAGPVKNNRLIRRGFLEGERRLLGQLASGGFRCLHQERDVYKRQIPASSVKRELRNFSQQREPPRIEPSNRFHVSFLQKHRTLPRHFL